MTWWCEAYGPPQGEMPPEAWPRCFLSPERSVRHCADARTCAEVMASERRRVHARIHELAAEGDPIAELLTGEFSTPDELLGGRQDEDETP